MHPHLHIHKDIPGEQTNQTSHKNKLKIMLHRIETVKLQYLLQTSQELWITTLFPSALPLQPKQVPHCETL